MCNDEITPEMETCDNCGKNLKEPIRNYELEVPKVMQIMKNEIIQSDGSILSVINGIKRALPNLNLSEHISTDYVLVEEFTFAVITTFKGTDKNKEIDLYEAALNVSIKGYITNNLSPVCSNLAIRRSNGEIVYGGMAKSNNSSVNNKYDLLFLWGVGLTVFVLLFFMGTCSSCGNNSSPKTPQELRKAQVEKVFSQWDGSLPALTTLIKESMNDPSSYEHVQTRYVDNKDHLIVRTTFRGKNAFGGLVTNSVTAKVSMSGKIIEVISD